MENFKQKFSILLPLLFAFTLLAGVLIGKMLSKSNNNISLLVENKPNKLDLLLNLVENNYVDKIDIDSIVEDVLPQVLADLDPHSVYIPASEMTSVREPLEGNFEGIGVQFNIQNDTIMIINTISGGPSEKAGILPGDRIITINDSIFAGKKITSNDVMKNLKGVSGTKVKVGIHRKGMPDLMHFEITRDKIPLNSIDVSYMIDDKIGYIKLSRFAQTTYTEFNEAVKDLKSKGMTSLIFDLRSNGGGYLGEAVKIADEFLPKQNLIVYTQGSARRKDTYPATSRGEFETGNLVILIDSWSASASEIVAGAIQDNDRGIIVGQRSYGKGLVQEPTMFSDSSVVRLTVARYYTPTGRCIQRSYTNGQQDYFDEINRRWENGELNVADSVHFSDSLQFRTTKGKIVYGGGGIMPDSFVPIDTTYISHYLNRITSAGLIYNFALSYTDDNRKVLNKFTNYQEITEYLDNQRITEKFINYASKHNISPKNGDLKKSGRVIDIRLKAFIARNILDNKGFYPVIQQIDETLNVAIEILKKPE